MHTKKSTKKRQGFSLIELIVVIAIIGIMTAILFSATLNDRTKRDVEVAARQLTVGLREAQNNALTGKRLDAKRSCTFTFMPQGTSYRIDYTYYEPGVTPDSNGDGIPNCADAESGTMVSATPFAKGVAVTGPETTFIVPHGTVIVNGEQIKTSQTFTVIKDTTVYAVCLSPSGRIDEVGIVESQQAAKTACSNL